MKPVLSSLLLLLSLVAASSVSAESPEHRVGIGILAGEPTGLALKLALTDTYALQGAVGQTYVEDDDENRVQWHLDLVANVSEVSRGVTRGARGYAGIGIRYKEEEGREEELVGLRIPFGVAMPIQDVPFDVFVELVPVLDLDPETTWSWNAGIGLRFLFF